MKIEKGIPIPKKIGGQWATTKFGLVHEMEVGDSILFDDVTTAAAATSRLRTAKRKKGFKFCVRSVEGGFRVWRLA